MNMDIIAALPGFILAFILIFYYEYRIKMIKNKTRNRIHFYVARDKDGTLSLYLGKPFRGHTTFYSDSLNRVCLAYNIDHFGFNCEDFDYLKWEDEPVEVFLNMEE